MSSFDISGVLGVPELSAHIEAVSQELANVVASDNPYLHEPISRIIKSRGKRLRPSLIIAIATAHGKKIDKTVITGCVAIELIHIASLVHDDIIDKADSRRNIPTINSTEGLANAIVAGDYLLACAHREAAKISVEASEVLALAFAAICDGQARELSDNYNLARTKESYLRAINGKTASLFAATCQVGGICAGLGQGQITALTHYGENFGMAFQLIDDVLDFVSTPDLSGKPVGNDIKEGVYTMPLLLALAGTQGEKARMLLRTQKQDLTDLLVQTESISQTLIEAQNYNQAACNALRAYNGTSVRDLMNIPDSYSNWALGNLTSRQYRSKLSGLSLITL